MGANEGGSFVIAPADSGDQYFKTIQKKRFDGLFGGKVKMRISPQLV
jgi:hypothetical protein